MRPLAARALTLLAMAIAATPALAAPSIERPMVILQGLDKVTARITEFRAPVGEELVFGKLRIRPEICLETPPIEPPESAVFLEIREREADASASHLFSGWMFASSPGLSALEHAVYDVWVVGCEDPEAEARAPREAPTPENSLFARPPVSRETATTP